MTALILSALLAGSSANDAAGALAMAQAVREREAAAKKAEWCPCGCDCEAGGCLCRDSRRCSSGCRCDDMPATQPAAPVRNAGIAWARQTGYVLPPATQATPAVRYAPAYATPLMMPRYQPAVAPYYQPAPVMGYRVPAPASYYAPQPMYAAPAAGYGGGRAASSNC